MDGSVKPFNANPTKWSNVFPSEYCKNVKNIILKNSCERLLLCSKRLSFWKSQKISRTKFVIEIKSHAFLSVPSLHLSAQS